MVRATNVQLQDLEASFHRTRQEGGWPQLLHQVDCGSAIPAHPDEPKTEEERPDLLRFQPLNLRLQAGAPDHHRGADVFHRENSARPQPELANPREDASSRLQPGLKLPLCAERDQQERSGAAVRWLHPSRFLAQQPPSYPHGKLAEIRGLV